MPPGQTDEEIPSSEPPDIASSPGVQPTYQPPPPSPRPQPGDSNAPGNTVRPASSPHAQALPPSQNMPQTRPVDTSNFFQPDSPQPSSLGPDTGGKKKKLLMSVAGVTIICLGLGWLFGFYLPNKPQNVWRTGLDRTGSVINDLVIASTEKDKLEQIKKNELTGSLEINGGGTSFSGSFSTKYDTKKSDSRLDIRYKDASSQEKKFSTKLLSELPDNTDLPNVYFQLSGLDLLGVGALFPSIEGYDGKWISVSSEYLKSIQPPEAQKELKKKQKNNVTKTDVAELARIVSSATQEYVFTSDTDKSVLVQKQFVGTEKLDDGTTANHYVASFNKANAGKYCEALIDRFMSADSFKKLPGVNPDNIERDKQKTIKSCQDSAKRDIKDSYTFDVWIDKKLKIIHKIRFTDEKEKGTYIEVGQDFRGGDELPLFVVFHSDKGKYDAKLTLDVDTAKSTSKGSFDLSYDGDPKYTAKASFEFKPYAGEINVEKPANAIPIERVFKQLGFDPVKTVAAVNSKAEDTKRKNDINSIYSQLEIYYAKNGYYPSLDQVNTPSWRSANFRGLDSSALKDPLATSAILAPTASKVQYGYAPSGCNATGQKCSSYTLVAVLSSGKIFAKKSFN